RCPFQRSRLKGPLTIRIFSDAAPILLALSLLMRPPQTDSGPSAVTIDKFDSGGLQGTPNGQIVCGRHGCLLKLSAVDRAQAHGRLARKLVCRPPKECPGRPDLRIRKWFFFVLTHDTSYVIFYVNRTRPAGAESMKSGISTKSYESRSSFIGGSDARIIMSDDEATLVRLWREKRGEARPEGPSGSLIVQLGRATEELNRSWYERNTGRQVRDVQRRVRHSAIPWMAATLDGIVEGTEAVFEAKFMLPWSFSEEAAAEKYMAQVQHNMWVTHLRSSVLSIITGGGKWVEITIPMDPLYLSVLVSAEKKLWRCVQSGEPSHLMNAEPPRPRIEAIRIVDMSASNSWAEFAALYCNTRGAFLDHERAKSELKALMPEDAKEAIGHGVKAKRSKSGAVRLDVLEMEETHATVQ